MVGNVQRPERAAGGGRVHRREENDALAVIYGSSWLPCVSPLRGVPFKDPVALLIPDSESTRHADLFDEVRLRRSTQRDVVHLLRP